MAKSNSFLKLASKSCPKAVVLDVDGSWQCPHCKEENNTEKPEDYVQCTWCEVTYKIILVR